MRNAFTIRLFEMTMAVTSIEIRIILTVEYLSIISIAAAVVVAVIVVGVAR